MEGKAEISLLVLGDSAAAGVGVNHQAEALTGKLVSLLSPIVNLRWKLLARTGDNSADIIKRLTLEEPNVYHTVVISVGVNDVTGFTSTSAWLNNLQIIIEHLKSNFDTQYIYFSSLPPMHLFPALPQPLRWWLGVRAKKLNKIMANLVTTKEGCYFVEASFPIEQKYIAIDGFHPAAAAYSLWAEQVAKLLLAAIPNSANKKDEIKGTVSDG